MGRRDKPHPQLKVLNSRECRGSMFGGWEETTYRCDECGALIEHTNDKNEFAPFWYFVDEK